MRFWSNITFPRAVSTCPVCEFSGVIGFLRKVERVLDPRVRRPREVALHQRAHVAWPTRAPRHGITHSVQQQTAASVSHAYFLTTMNFVIAASVRFAHLLTWTQL